MNSEANEPIGNQSWLAEFLSTKGFRLVSPDKFSNGKATIEFNGSEFTAHPGFGDQAWSSDLEGADCATIKLLIEQVLKLRPFFSDTDIDKESIEKQRIDHALTGIANTIREGPDTHSGVQLRRFLWSLYNGHHLVNLWTMTCVLDSKRSAWISEIFAGRFVGSIKEPDIKRALRAAGEIGRWNDVPQSPDHIGAILEAERAIESVLRTLPPCSAHAALKIARDSLWEARDSIRRVKKSPNEEQ